MNRLGASRRNTLITLLVIGAGLVVLGGVNVTIGRDKTGDYDVGIAAIQERADETNAEASPRDLENARGKRAFYLGVQQAGWWLIAGGLALTSVGLGFAWLGERSGSPSLVRSGEPE